MQKFTGNLWKIIPLFLILSMQSTVSQGFAPDINKADSLFQAKAYTEALQEYEQLLAEGKYAPRMLAKMALIQEGFGNVSEALYYLTLLNRQSPNEVTLRKLAELSKSHNLEGYAVNDESYFIYLFRRYKGEFLLLLSTIGLLSLFGLFWGKRRGYSPIASGVALTIYMLAVAWLFNFQSPSSVAIVMEDNSFVMNAPSAGATLLTSLEAGHRLSIKNKIDIWYEVEWQGQQAFVREKNVQIVK